MGVSSITYIVSSTTNKLSMNRLDDSLHFGDSSALPGLSRELVSLLWTTLVKTSRCATGWASWIHLARVCNAVGLRVDLDKW